LLFGISQHLFDFDSLAISAIVIHSSCVQSSFSLPCPFLSFPFCGGDVKSNDDDLDWKMTSVQLSSLFICSEMMNTFNSVEKKLLLLLDC